MNESIGIASTILLPSGTTQDKHRKHLFVVMCKPVQGSVLLVSIATRQRFYDTTCILNAGDHSFIKHESYVAYDLAKTERVQNLESGIEKGQYRLHKKLAKSVFQKILKGFYQSTYTKNYVWEYLPAKYEADQ